MDPISSQPSVPVNQIATAQSQESQKETVTNNKGSKFSFLPYFIFLIIIAVGIGTLYIYQKPLLLGKVKKTPAPQISTTHSPTPSSDPTLNWKIYEGETIYSTDGTTMFSIKYPAEWKLEKNVLYPFGEEADSTLEPRILLGTGGRGWPETTIETHKYPAGEAKYSWINENEFVSAFASFTHPETKGAYIIEVQNLPSKYNETYKIIFDHMLSTFKYGGQIDTTLNWKEYKVKKLGLIFRAPPNLDVQINEGDTSNATTLYIQDYPFNAPPPDPYYQLYGIYNDGIITDLSIATWKKELTNPKEVIIGGKKTIEGQVKGERNRYVSHIILEYGYLSFFTAQVSAENKLQTDKILLTFEFEK